jgi:deoxyribodipyrimidine photo-lyase
MTPDSDQYAPPNWHPDRASGVAQLERFLPRAGAYYKRHRNTDPGPQARDGVSQLSPWLRHRLLTEPEVLGATLEHHAFGTAEKFLQEVCWRSYWKGFLERRPSLWSRYRESVRNAFDTLGADDVRHARYQAATAGQTEIACFDAWVDELVTTGYLHNHARMWFASIWVFTLGLPWSLGADFFLRHLLDGDPAANTLSWRWVAGLQTPGKTYLARAGNIQRHTDGRFAPAADELAATAPPVGDPDLPPVQELPAADPVPNEAAILLTEDDLTGLDALDPLPAGSGLAVLEAAGTRSPYPTGDQARAFTRQACQNALADAEQRTGRHGTLLSSEQPADALIKWIRDSCMTTIVMPWTPRGPAADFLDTAAPVLANEGIALYRVRRDWDSQVWPHATRGFFAFWKPVSRQLRAGELPLDRPWAD